MEGGLDEWGNWKCVTFSRTREGGAAISMVVFRDMVEVACLLVGKVELGNNVLGQGSRVGGYIYNLSRNAYASLHDSSSMSDNTSWY